MKKAISIFFLFVVLLGSSAFAQTIARSVVSTAGGTLSGGGYSINYNIGETLISTLSSGSNMITQGFEQPTESSLNLTVFIQGYYQNIGSSTPMDNYGSGGALFINGLSVNANDADNIEVSLMDPQNGSLVESQTGVLHTDGSLSVRFSETRVGNSYWLRVRHRNSIETWSAAPVQMTVTKPYNFSASADKAYGNNQVEVETGVWAIYSGDIVDADTQTAGVQDGVIESSDYSQMENDVYNVLDGYVLADITGDGVVESADYSIMENNVYLVISVMRPF